MSDTKRRPAVVLSSPMRDDVILCQVTSRNNSDSFAVPVSPDDFVTGSIRDPSLVRPNKLFTFDTSLVLYTLGHLHPEKIEAITAMAVRALQ
ncbi:MAG: type II toxin-antitoxin system PemK/MazF family toxin [Methanomicrobiales archaeon]|nr:type II toxin-antitoxin system PemK/MazF family toxin [Methanomicrobiales archaeon]